MLYAMLMHPTQRMPDGRTIGQSMLQASFATVAKKYAPDWEQLRMNRDARAWLMAHPDPHAQRFYFLMILWSEPELQDLVCKTYKEGHHLWGTNEEARRHLRNFVDGTLSVMVKQTLDWPVSELNASDVVKNFVAAATKAYLTGE